MNAEDFLEGIAWALPFLLIAAVFCAIAAWKKSKGLGLHEQARQLLFSGNHEHAREVLLQALWKANLEPRLERRILADLCRLYTEAGIQYSADDYEVLIGQFEQLSKKRSHKALSEMKKVQVLKKELIERMPNVA